jgi:3D (Asp-Asp-Asp) domain-containing protein
MCSRVPIHLQLPAPFVTLVCGRIGRLHGPNLNLRRQIMANQKMLTAVFRDRMAASEVYSWLLNRGYKPSEINVLMTERTRVAFGNKGEEGKIKAGSKTAEGMATGGAVGTAVGAGVAAIAAIGTSVVVPGLGWVVAGPIFGALAGGTIGAVGGGAVGALIGLGISESNAAAYEEALRNGGVVIGVVPRNSDDSSAIESEFEEHNADNVVFA